MIEIIIKATYSLKIMDVKESEVESLIMKCCLIFLYIKLNKELEEKLNLIKGKN